MELKVWVDGVVRVVCGLSQETSCQDVVIALAQAIGQTGRYVLIQKLRDTERQLLADERPLEALAKLGQNSKDVQFFLRRTGPSSSEGSGLDRGTVLPKVPEPETLRRREPKKSLTFSLGPSSSPHTRLKQFKKMPRDSPEARASPSPLSPAPGSAPSAGTSKEEMLRLILQQQEKSLTLDAQLQMVEGRVREWERVSGQGPRQDEMGGLEEVARRNQAELVREAAWEEELHAEAERERGLRRRLAELHASLEDYSRRLHDCTARSARLEQEIQQEACRVESLDAVKVELHSQQQQGKELDASLTETERALGKAEALLQAKREELDELNKELRQCNLQQFIQQAGAPPVLMPSPTDPPEQLDLAKLQLDGYSNGGPVLCPTESPPRPTAKHFLGHPRNLQNPVVSSLNPEVLTSRESSWR